MLAHARELLDLTDARSRYPRPGSPASSRHSCSLMQNRATSRVLHCSLLQSRATSRVLHGRCSPTLCAQQQDSARASERAAGSCRCAQQSFLHG